MKPAPVDMRDNGAAPPLPECSIACYTLPNGEKLPLLVQYPAEGAEHPGLKPTLEVKTASSPEIERRAGRRSSAR